MTILIEKLIEALKTPLADMCIVIYQKICAILYLVLQFSRDDLTQTPSVWNVGAYNLVKGVCNNYILPFAVLIITFIMCYELVSMVTSSNNFHELDTSIFIKWLCKLGIALFLLDHSFEIISGIFVLTTDITTNLLNGISGEEAAAALSSFANGEALESYRQVLVNDSFGELFCFFIFADISVIFLYLAVPIVSMVTITRMVFIYINLSLAPIPMATLANREWGQIGNHYIRNILALAFQGVIIVVSFGIFYGVVTASVTAGQDLENCIVQIITISLVLLFVLFKTESISKSIFSA